MSRWPSGQRLVGGLLVMVLAATGTVGSAVAYAVDPDPGDARVHDVVLPPQTVPRDAVLLGATVEGLLYSVSTDQPFTGETRWTDTAGATRALNLRHPITVAGDRAVTPGLYNAPVDRSWRVQDLAGGDAYDLDEVPGRTILSVGAAGVLTRGEDVDGDLVLEVVDRDGVATSVAGFPAGTSWVEQSTLPPAAHEAGVVVMVDDATGPGAWFVDTVLARAEPLPTDATQVRLDQVAATGTAAAWFERDLDRDTWVVAVAARAGDDGVLVAGPTAAVPFAVTSTYQFPQLALSGTTVFVSAGVIADERARTTDPQPLLRLDGDERLTQVHPALGPVLGREDGTLSTVLPDGNVSRLVDLPPDWAGDPQDVGDVVLELPVLPTTPGAMAIDGDRLLVGGDVLWEYDTTGLPAGRLGEPRVRSKAVLDVATDGPTTLVRREAWPTFTISELSADGSDQAPPLEWGAGYLTGADDGLAVVRDHHHPRSTFVRLSDGQIVGGLPEGGDLVDGVRWTDARSVMNPRGLAGEDVFWPDGVIGHDLASGRADLYQVGPGCDAGVPQVAGRWLLAPCGAGGAVVDLQGELPRLELTGGADHILGDGVLLSATPDETETAATLQWLDLEDRTAGWRPLGSVRWTPYGRYQGAARVSQRGPVVAAVWRTPTGGLQVASFPSTGSSRPPRPTGPSTAPPAPTAVTAIPGDRSLAISFAHVAPSDARALGFRVEVREQDRPWVVQTVRATPTSQRATVRGLVNQRPYTVSVVAGNGIGVSAAAAGDQAVLPRSDVPDSPTVSVAVDPASDRAVVRWQVVGPPWYVAPDSFSVRIGDTVMATGLPGDARQLAVRVPQRGGQDVTVRANNGVHVSAPGVWRAYFSGTDTVVPRVTAVAIPEVTTGTSATFSWKATDDRRVASYDIRYRTASTGRTFGAWTQPPSWTARTSASVTVGPLLPGQTRCLSVRVRDGQGNVSGWTSSRCTVVPLDDRSLSASSPWARLSGSSYLGGTATRSSTVGASLQRSATRADAAWLVVSTCSRCGSVGVYDDGVRIATVDTRSATTQHRTVVPVAFGGKRSGVISLRPLTAAPVHVDGLGLRSY